MPTLALRVPATGELPALCQSDVPLFAYLRSLFGQRAGISFIDSTRLAVCHNARIHQHKTFAGLAKRGKTSTGLLLGFKLRLVCNDRGVGTLHCNVPTCFRPTTVRQVVWRQRLDLASMVRTLLESCGGYSTKLRRNMKGHLMLLADRLLLRRRTIAETILPTQEHLAN